MAAKGLVYLALGMIQGSASLAASLDIDAGRYPDLPNYGPQVSLASYNK